MKVARENSEIELAFQKIEDLMREIDIRINHSYCGLSLTYKGVEYQLKDIEGYDEGILSLPRVIESERIVIEE